MRRSLISTAAQVSPPSQGVVCGRTTRIGLRCRDVGGQETGSRLAGILNHSFPVGVRGFRFPAKVITVAVRRHLRHRLSYRDVEELLAERGAILATIA